MTPIFDANSNYRFVVAVQFEVASQHVTPSLARRRLVRLGRFLHQLPLMLPYSSTQWATSSMMRTPITQITRTSAKEYLEKREASTTTGYDGSSILLQRKANCLMTRCCWLMRPLDSISSIVNILIQGEINADVVEKFLQTSCPDVVRKLVAMVGSINVVLEAQEKLVEANLGEISDDVLAMLAILLKTFRTATKQKSALGMSKTLDAGFSQEGTKISARESGALVSSISESGNSNASSDWIDKKLIPQPQRPANAQSIRTSLLHVKRLAEVTSAISKGAGRTQAYEYNHHMANALLKTLISMLHNPHRKNVLLDELRQLRLVAASNLVNLLLDRMMSSESGELLVEQTSCAELSILQGDDKKAPLRATARLRTALGQVPAKTHQDSIWSDFLPALGFAVGGSIGLVAVDMRSPGLPLIYVNRGFEVLTKYGPEESIGRNCSFLQVGSEPTDVSQDYLIEELSASIRSHSESITKMFCFDKAGNRLQFMIILIPIFHASENHGAYTIGFQVRVETPLQLGNDLLTLDRMLRLLPRTTSSQVGAATFAEMMPLQAEAVLPVHIAAWLSLDGASPSNKGPMPRYTAMLDAFMRTLDKLALLAAVKQECSIVAAGLTQFVVEVDTLTAKPAGMQRRVLLRKLLLRMPRNYLFYFSTLEIELGSMDRTNFDAAYKVLKEWRDQLYPYLARIIVPVIYNFVKAQVGNNPAQEHRPSSSASNFGGREDDVGGNSEPNDRRLNEAARALLLLKNTDDTLASNLTLSMCDAPLPLALAVTTQTGDVLVRATNVACDNLARQSFGAGTRVGTAEAVRDYITSSEEARVAVLNWQPLTCIIPTGEFSLISVFQPVTCRTTTVIVVCICGGDDLYLARDLDMASSLISAIVTAQRVPHSVASQKNDNGVVRGGVVAHDRAEKGQYSRDSASYDTDSIVPESTSTRQPRPLTQQTVRGAMTVLPAWHFTTSGARAPVVVGSNQALTKHKWHQMERADKCRHVVEALKKIKLPKSTARQPTPLLVSQHPLVTSKDSAHEAFSGAYMSRKDLEDKVTRLEGLFDEAEVALQSVLDRCSREMANLERRQVWERDAMVRTHKAEIDELEMRQINEVQGFVDKVAESRSAAHVTPAGRTKRPPCACMHSYLCVHNKRGIFVVNKESPGLERKHTVAANSLVAQHAKFRDALLQRHKIMLDFLSEKHEAATKVLSSRHSLLSRKAEFKLNAIERDLQETYLKLKRTA